MKIKTIDVYAKEWFDKVNGNSYFSARVIMNYQLKNESAFFIPIQYGYGDHYRYIAYQELKNKGYVPKGANGIYWQYYKDNNIIARHFMQENCKKRDLNK